MRKPTMMERHIYYRYNPDSKSLYELFPFAINLRALKQLDLSDAEARKVIGKFKPYNPREYPFTSPPKRDTNNYYTLLYRLGLIEVIDTSKMFEHETAEFFRLSMLGRSALLSLEQGMVWTVGKGADKELTREFYDARVRKRQIICSMPSPSTHSGFTYYDQVMDVGGPELEHLAQNERMKRHQHYKQFLHALLLEKLSREPV